MGFEFIPKYGKYNKPILFLILIVAIPMILIPQFTNDVNFITYSGTSFLAILIAGLAIIVARVFTDKTSEEIKTLGEKIDKIPEKLTNATIQAPTNPPEIDVNQLPFIIKEWEIVIQTQMHFNDLIMKVRTATLSVVLAVFGAAGYSFAAEQIAPFSYNGIGVIHPAAFIISSGIAILIAVFVVDYGYYYKMLIGAVKRGYEFDQEFEQLQEKFGRRYFGMSSTISNSIGQTGASKYFVALFYIIPIIGGIVFLLAVLIGYQAPNV